MRRGALPEVLGAGLGAALAAGLLALIAVALYLRTHNAGESALAEMPATAHARALAALARQALGRGDRAPDLKAAVGRLRRAQPTIRRAAVVSEPRSFKYRFLRQRRYLVHDRSSRTGQALDPRRAEDKGIHDLVSRVRREGAQIHTVSRPGEPLRVEAAFPLRAGTRLATAVIVTEPRGGASPLPAWPIGAGLLGCALLGLLLGALFGRRARYLLITAASVGVAVFYHLFLERLHEGYAAALGATEQGLVTALPEAFEGQQAASFWLPGSGTWALLLGAAGATMIGLLGSLGVGAHVAGTLRRHRFAYAYLLPAALGMAILVFVPFGYGLALGFFDHAHGSYTFVGLSNFVEILSGGGRPITHPMNFYFTLGVTVLWTFVNVLLHTAIGLGLALLLKDPLLRFKGVYRVLLILPWAVPSYITALIWKGMFHQQYGAVNHALSLIGLEKVSWFSSFSTAFTANVATNTWLGFPFMMVVSLGALQSIPREVYEAAAVDGASPWQSFRRITLPLLRPALFPAVVLGSIWTFNMFNIIYLVSNGEPAGATDILITEAYRWAFERADRYGLAAAYALIIFAILLAYTLITNRLARATEDVLG